MSSFAQPTYTAPQLHRYLSHISFPSHDALPPPTLRTLQTLMTHHLAAVPFENLVIHYSPAHAVVLDPEVLYTKVVEQRRGGYCMEINAFFSIVLRSLGFSVWTTGARVAVDEAFQGWNHMLSIVTVSGQDYAVDVGFGGNGPVQPLPLIPEMEHPGAGPQQYRLQRRPLPFAANAALQPLWVLQHRNDATAPWQSGYAFSSEVEFCAADYEIMSFVTSQMPDSIFRKMVVCVKTLVVEGQGDGWQTVGRWIITDGIVKKRVMGVTEVVRELGSERERVQALREFFGIELTPEEQEAIRGMSTELKEGERRERAKTP